jgi:hypothetical protein
MTKYRYSDSDFIRAVETSFSVRDALKKLGVAPHGGSYKTFYLRIKKLNIDTAHFLGQGHLKGKSHFWGKRISLEDLLVANSDLVFSTKYKQRIIDEGLLENKCSKCGLKDLWQNEHIVLHLDHINGDHFDHRIENIRLLCPNCHSQTPTYCSKNKGINIPKVRKSLFIPQEPNKCETCGVKIIKGRKNCRKCYNDNRKLLQAPYERKTKIIWPSIEELKSKLEVMSYLALGKELGISDNAIRKHIKNAKAQ